MKYKPEIKIETDYYGQNIDQIQFIVDDIVCISQERIYGDEFYDFGDGVINISTNKKIGE